MSAIQNNPTSAPPSSTDAFNTMSSEDFIKVMFAELQRQDPTQPNDSKDLLQQLSSIRGIESDLSLQKNLKAMLQQSELTSAGSLIGKFAIGMNASGARVSGYVDAITVTREGIQLDLSTGHQVPFSRVEQIIDPSIIDQTPPPDDDDDTGNDDDDNTNNNGNVPPVGNNDDDDNAPPADNDDDDTPPVNGGDNNGGNNGGNNDPTD
ncbi:MAG TPA: flagellar hook capping FlgD N-terminal domain-containing protein [Phycisphaerales bacterium]|nr:flagellar hook capping FlgD N-terminal domain-containing protein [Phycisphaerales bacterium]